MERKGMGGKFERQPFISFRVQHSKKVFLNVFIHQSNLNNTMSTLFMVVIAYVEQQ
jgi:hypothetical protein